jgi:hypothetical protein
MLDELWKNNIQELKFGYLKKKHPFRYFSLSTFGPEYPESRTVVLRDVSSENELIIFTDKRSQKINQLKTNPNASALFYHPKKLLQLKINGQLQLILSGEEYDNYKSRIQGNSVKDYLTTQAPGSEIKQPDEVDYQDEMQFALLKLIPYEIEVLQLKRPNHIRCIFYKEKNWKGNFLTP